MEILENLKKEVKAIIGKDILIVDPNGSQKFEITEPYLNYLKNEQGLHILIKTCNGENISVFRLLQMPGCCGICISTQNFIFDDFRGKGLNNIFNKFRMNVAKYLGYTILLCTDLHDNEPQKKTLVKNGWKDIYSFINDRTGNLLDISIVKL